MSSEADILTLVVGVSRLPRHVIRRDEQCIEAVFRLDVRRHASEEFELLVRHLEVCVALSFILEEGHRLVDENGQWVLRISVEFALRQV